MYPYHNALERLSIEAEYIGQAGVLSIGKRPYKDWAVLTAPEPQYNAIVYHKIDNKHWLQSM